MTQRLAFAGGLILFSTCVHAQTPPASSGLNRAALPTVFVRDDQGVETRGKLLNLDSESIVLLIGGAERRFETRHVARVEKRGDSLKNGAIIGAVVGAVLGGLGSAMADCTHNGRVTRCGFGSRIALGTISTGLYAAVGAGIDAAIPGRTTLYEAPRAPAARSGSLAFRIRW